MLRLPLRQLRWVSENRSGCSKIRRRQHINQLNAIISGTLEAAIEAAVLRNDYAEERTRNIVLELIASSDVPITFGNRKS
ncbi:hypothetical protein QN362_04720 [Actimicrobium sp. CCC2.4]|uniref:hypothetical protein n=1 Tax=Actimicrobium sp. CCC2.4 TaxID=3048606 RepID=UPI002AC935FA|nr:hypothetical protein [Actimicrobium sp. CCC2.4]MEB0134631.1 hypothetical protein [Actimicrobium sp. CCC2.4]WPX30573.1 hypothetical protein RHM62_09800 [Actimicrobium sp. CCC2.4]